MSQPRDKWMDLLIDTEIFKGWHGINDAAFHQSIFYVGVGEPSRPLRYAKDSVDGQQEPSANFGGPDAPSKYFISTDSLTFRLDTTKH
jgi:hypothetical protein